MSKYLAIMAVLYCYSINSISGQIPASEVPASLEKLFLRLRGNYPAVKKLEINDSIRLIIDSYSSSDTVFNHRFSRLRYLGQITSPDSLVKIITWNLMLEEGGNRYFCNLIRRSSRNAKSKIYRLSGYYSEKPVRTDTLYSDSDWYGALYYDLRPFLFEGANRYLILGIDYGNPFITRKIIDVLDFENPDRLVFGLKCFEQEGYPVTRVVFEYSAKAVMSLKFEADDKVVFDHLSPFSPGLKDNKQFYGPDFSFDSFNFENGYWRFMGDIDVKNR